MMWNFNQSKIVNFKIYIQYAKVHQHSIECVNGRHEDRSNVTEYYNSRALIEFWVSFWHIDSAILEGGKNKSEESYWKLHSTRG